MACRNYLARVEIQCQWQKKAKKRRITNSTVTQTSGGFTSDELDTVADWGWRIFLWEGVVNGTVQKHAICNGPKTRHLQAIFGPM